MQQAQISVVIPTYNRARLLPRAIKSALDQQTPIKEVIVVDDGSTDDTIPMLREWESKEPRLFLIEETHNGASHARNVGIEQASGEWIAFLDSDDCWMPEKLQMQLEAVTQSPEYVASFTGLRMHDGRSQEVDFIPRANPSLFDLRGSNVLSSTSSALIKAETLRSVGGFDAGLPSCQDWDLWFRLRQAGSFVIVEKVLTHIDSGDHARITTNRPKVLEGHRLMFDRLCAGVPPGPELRRIKAKHELVMSSLERKAGNYSSALSYAWASCSRYPSKWGVRSLCQSLAQVMRQMLK